MPLGRTLSEVIWVVIMIKNLLSTFSVRLGDFPDEIKNQVPTEFAELHNFMREFKSRFRNDVVGIENFAYYLIANSMTESQIQMVAQQVFGVWWSYLIDPAVKFAKRVLPQKLDLEMNHATTHQMQAEVLSVLVKDWNTNPVFQRELNRFYDWQKAKEK